jgi:hypothetical protein
MDMEAANKCSGGVEPHLAHMELNGECPWCGHADEGDILSPFMSPEDAVAEVVKRHG